MSHQLPPTHRTTPREMRWVDQARNAAWKTVDRLIEARGDTLNEKLQTRLQNLINQAQDFAHELDTLYADMHDANNEKLAEVLLAVYPAADEHIGPEHYRV